MANAQIPRTLGRWDLVLLKVVAIVNINNVPPVAVYGWTSLVLWIVAFVTFFVPEAIAVLTLARRHPGEGGIYLWTRREFGDAHGFLSGWCYWTNNLFYVPVLLVYMTGIFAFAGGEARAADLVNQKLFVAAVSFGWLALITVANIRGLAVGKWIQNIGGLGAFLSVGLVLVAAAAAWAGGVGAHATGVTHFSWEMTTSFAVMCNALVGIELASTMGDEIRNPGRDLAPAIAIAGVVSIASYLLVTGAVLTLVPVEQLGVIQGVMQAVSAGAHAAHVGWIIVPLAIVMGLATGGAASAWFAGSSRIPFVAGLTSALPPALGRIHPEVALAAHRARHVRGAGERLHGVFARRIERGRSVPGAAQGRRRHPADSVHVLVPRARENGGRHGGRARGWRARAVHDHRRPGRGVPADSGRHERGAVRGENGRRRRRSDGAGLVSVQAHPDGDVRLRTRKRYET